MPTSITPAAPPYRQPVATVVMEVGIGDQSNMVFSGTAVAAVRARARSLESP